MDIRVWVRSQEGVPREKRTTLRTASGGTSNLMTAGAGGWGEVGANVPPNR